jgi:hypothetical protein
VAGIRFCAKTAVTKIMIYKIIQQHNMATVTSHSNVDEKSCLQELDQLLIDPIKYILENEFDSEKI